jgi:hypothetical protein
VAKQEFHIEEAFSFYKQFILQYSHDKAAIYNRYGFTLQGSVSSKDWEVFAAILLGDNARLGHGADLMKHEVKSAVIGNSFEYQYHKKNGIEKLSTDKTVDHLFIARSKAYNTVEVWLVDRIHLVPIFDSWLPELQENYQADSRQRFRKSINSSTVRQYGERILMILRGNLDDSTGSESPED